MLLRGNNHRSAIVVLASSMTVLLIAGAAAAHDVATDPRPARVVQVEATAAPFPVADRAADDAPRAEEPDPAAAVGLPAPASPTTGAAAPAAVAPPPSPQQVPPSPNSTATAPTTRVAPPPTFVIPPAPPKPPPAPLETVEIGPGAWRSTFDGITATLRMTPVAPRAGQVVHFSIDATYTGEGCCTVAFYPGDGTMLPLPPGINSMDCTQAPSSMHREHSHTYTRADSFMVHLQPSVLPCRITPDGRPLPINSHLYATISVGPAT